MISVLVLTFNEELNIRECIAALPWRSDVWVLDSISSDRTREYAQAVGAKVVCRKFTDYADQRNFGLSLPAGDWIVMLDADERMTPELAAEIQARVDCALPELAMMRVRRKDYFMNKWIRRSSGYPTWFPRVFRRDSVTVERPINETYRAAGGTAQLQGHLLHYPFNKGLDWWFERHNRYSSAEAELLAAPPVRSILLGMRSIFSRDPSTRRAAFKELAYRLPGRPFLVFGYLYFLRLGFLDGRPGYQFACMRLAYELMIDAKASQIGFEKLGHAKD
jgi:glycosyltransferase involved in cell wall biosynthesis